MDDKHSEIIMYQTEDGLTKINVQMEDDTVWLTQAQMTELFQTSKQNISLHVGNVFSEGELDPNSVVKDSLTTAADGKKYKKNLQSRCHHLGWIPRQISTRHSISDLGQLCSEVIFDKGICHE